MTSGSQSTRGREPAVCVGEALVDLIGSDSEDWSQIGAFIPRIGGAPANMSVAIARLGGHSAFLGCRADDEPGLWIEQRLTAEGVDVSSLNVVTESQTRLAIVTGPIEHRKFRFYGDPPADTCLTPLHVDEAGIERASAVLISSIGLTREPSRSAVLRVLERCMRNSIPIVFDPNPRPGTWNDPQTAFREMEPLIREATILKLGVGEAELLGRTVDAIRGIRRRESVTVLTDGPRGCWYWLGNDEPRFVETIPVKQVDSTGAGDAFTAALALRYVETGGTLRYGDFRFASVVGALTTTQQGAMDALPYRDRVESVLYGLTE